MDISKAPNPRKLQLCRTYFMSKCHQLKGKSVKLSTYFFFLLAGFAFLPFVWAINVCWFFAEAFQKPPYPEQNQIKRCKRTFFAFCVTSNLYPLSFVDVIYSAIGTLFWTILLITWIIIFQTNRADWGASADYISFIIPLGSA